MSSLYMAYGIFPGGLAGCRIRYGVIVSPTAAGRQAFRASSSEVRAGSRDENAPI
jgi:hypothetical protein